MTTGTDARYILVKDDYSNPLQGWRVPLSEIEVAFFEQNINPAHPGQNNLVAVERCFITSALNGDQEERRALVYEKARETVEIIRARHPLLRVAVVKDADNKYYFHPLPNSTNAPIYLWKSQRWEELASTDLNTAFQTGEALFRVHICESDSVDGTFYIVVVFQHAIADAGSVRLFLEEFHAIYDILIALTAEPTNSQLLEELQTYTTPVSFPESVENPIPSSMRIPNRKTLLASLAREIAQLVRSHQLIHLPLQSPLPETTRGQWLSFHLTPENSELLESQCRRRNVSIVDLLGAVFSYSMAEVEARKNRDANYSYQVNFIVTSDFRTSPEINSVPKVNEDEVPLSHTLPIEARVSTWKLAKLLQGQREKLTASTTEQIQPHQMFPTMMLLTENALEADFTAHMMGFMGPMDTVKGRATTFRFIDGMIGVQGLGSHAYLCAFTVDGQLNLSIGFHSGMQHQAIIELVHEFKLRLETLAKLEAEDLSDPRWSPRAMELDDS